MIKFLNRALGGFIILTFLVLITYMGRIPLALGVAGLSYVALYEIDRALKNIDLHIPMKGLFVTNGLIMLAAYINNSDVYIASIVVSVLYLFIYIIVRSHYTLYDGFAAAFVMLYISFLISHILRIKDDSYVWILYITAWGSDTFAYLIGSLFGKRKIQWMAHISPNKTVEGSIGGILGAIALNMIYAYEFNLGANPVKLIVFTIIAASMSQIGDLIASYIKRQTGIKDFGHIIPGHGGILDRFDSILFISPCMFLFTLV